ncbi:MAG: uncharacterized protein JWM57_1958 [Phycisphaerales bacterium]|nr:uncharacterized protein [Phycisphaerales bacterium]
MPTVLRVGPYRFFFYSNENTEPPHIHVERDDDYAKFWLQPVQLARNVGFSAHELHELIKLTREHAALFMERWNEHFGH